MLTNSLTSSAGALGSSTIAAGRTPGLNPVALYSEKPAASFVLDGVSRVVASTLLYPLYRYRPLYQYFKCSG